MAPLELLNESSLNERSSLGREGGAGRAKDSGASSRAPGRGEENSERLSREEVQDIHKNCIKLAAESKINAKNSFHLQLIEHMGDLVKSDEGGETNFQRASCTLDAGVQIYSYRVDAVHTDAFKTLQGLNRTAMHAEDEDEDVPDENAQTKRRARKEANPESTLESFESLNVKKFDLTFSVDPLFHRTSAQFDAAGAAGLLLHNLSVLNGCSIVFDSRDVPEDLLSQREGEHDVQLDVSSLPPLPERPVAADISPAVRELRQRLEQTGASRLQVSSDSRELVSQALCENNMQRTSAAVLPTVAPVRPAEPIDEVVDEAHDAWEPESDFYTANDNGGESSVYYGMSDEIGGPGAGVSSGQGVSADNPPASEAGDVFADAQESQEAEELSPLEAMLSRSIGSHMLGGRNWAGASHWRYRPAQAANPQASAEEDTASAETATTTESLRNSRAKKAELDFLQLPALPDDAFKLAAKPELLCLAASTLESQASTLLPEDHKYTVHDLAKPFLRPRSTWAARAVKATTESVAGDNHGVMDFGFDGLEDADAGDSGFFDDEEEGQQWCPPDAIELAEAPRKVARVEIGYSRVAKQVDVRALKELLWDCLESMSAGCDEEAEDTAELPSVKFEDVLTQVPDISAAGTREDLSVHLCFICTLHLANEHGLRIDSGPYMDTLRIALPASGGSH